MSWGANCLRGCAVSRPRRGVVLGPCVVRPYRVSRARPTVLPGVLTSQAHREPGFAQLDSGSGEALLLRVQPIPTCSRLIGRMVELESEAFCRMEETRTFALGSVLNKHLPDVADKEPP